MLGIETSSRRGSVALVEDGRAVAARVHQASSAHGERVLPLIDELFAETGWPRTSLDRVAAGIGPGSFTGVRVALAIAQGIGLGLGRPVVGVGSLRAMCREAPAENAGRRCAVLDARREELFCAIYAADGTECVAPCLVRVAAFGEWVSGLADPPSLVLGEAVPDGLPALHVFRSELTDLPHAIAVARIGGEAAEPLTVPEPLYVRPPDAIRPKPVRSPLSSNEPQ